MKRISIILLLAIIATSALAQTKAKPKATAPVKKPVVNQRAAAQQVSLKTLSDSASYAIGQNLAQSITKDLNSLNKQAFMEAIKTVFDGKQGRFDEAQIRNILTEFSKTEEENRSKTTIDAGRAMLEKNKSNPKIKTTASGLQYEVIKEGTGIKPTAQDSVVCHYKGMLVDSTEFDNSYKRGEPLTIALNNVIRGWTEGVQLMPVGSTYRFYIPYELGYGLRGAGDIPAGSALIFDIELLEVKKPK